MMRTANGITLVSHLLSPSKYNRASFPPRKATVETQHVVSYFSHHTLGFLVTAKDQQAPAYVKFTQVGKSITVRFTYRKSPASVLSANQNLSTQC
jgi:hypothetical protein